jgi:hypothetical protein
MSKKKAGRLSGSMIVRRRGHGDVGFVIGETKAGARVPEGGGAVMPRKPERRPRQDEGQKRDRMENHVALGSDMPPEEGQSERKVAQVVPLYPGPPGETTGSGAPARPLGGGVHARADRLVDALRSADIAEAEEVFAAMTGLGQVDVLRLLYGPEGKDLALVCRAMGLEQLQFVSVYILARKLGLGEEALDARELARIVAYFDALDETEAEAALAGWRAGGRGDAGKPHGPA